MHDGPSEPSLDNTYLEPLLSRNTDEFHSVLSARFPPSNQFAKSIAVHALNIKPISLFEPVLPPGYRFVVLDADCNVLFHSESFRNMRETFCQESKYNTELRPWLFNGADTSLDISYGGHTERAYLTTLHAPPRFTVGHVFLMVFREPDVDLTLNLAIILVSSILMGFYFLLVLLVVGVHLAVRASQRSTYTPRFMWPCAENALSYAQLVVANSAMLLLFGLFYAQLYEGPLLALTLAVALLSILFVVFKLNWSHRGLPVLGMILIVAALCGWLVSDHQFLESARVFVFFGVSGLTAILLSGRISWISRLMPSFRKPAGDMTLGAEGTTARARQKQSKLSASESWRRLISLQWVRYFATKHFKLAYAVTALTLITSAGLVPCIGSFKYAYDAVSELSMKHDQLKLSEALLFRKGRIRKYYSETVRPPENTKGVTTEIAERRTMDTMDRYDARWDLADSALAASECNCTEDDSFFLVGCESSHDGQHAKTEAATAENCPIRKPCNIVSTNQTEPESDVNEWIEKHLARFTLQFPSNQLGSEMSKLGVASTEHQDDSGHFWKEVTPRRFTLFRELESGSQKLTVTSEYRKWEGLRGWAWLCLVILLVLLTVWLRNLAGRIFFTDIENTRPLRAAEWESVEDIDGHFLIIGQAKSGKSKWLRSIDGLEDHWLDLRRELRKKVEDRSYEIPQGHGAVLVLDHFDVNITDHTYNEARLKLLEALLYESAIKVVVVSTIDPLYFLTEGAPETLSQNPDRAVARGLLDRWATALSHFTKLRSNEPNEDALTKACAAHFEKTNSEQGEFATWVWRECNCTAMLRRIGMQLLHEFRKDDRATPEWVWRSVLQRADAYYHVLWSLLTATERLVLYQLALDGWANPKNAAAIQQLERKLLICKAPMYRVMNESFRLFIQSTEHAEEIAEWEKREQQSTWHAFRYVIIGAVISAGVWLLYTQAALTQVLAGSIAAIVTLLTAITGLWGRSGRRPSTASNET